MTPLIHLDMDSVISDFMYEYTKLKMEDSRIKFRHAVMEHRIFTKLPYMPNAPELINLLFVELGAKVEILSSLGTWDREVADQARAQKSQWLDERNIFCSRQFVNSWAVKKDYATPYSIMIDDRADVVEQYINAGGWGIVYVADDFDNMRKKIINAYNEMKG